MTQSAVHQLNVLVLGRPALDEDLSRWVETSARVAYVDTFVEALEALRAEPFDLVISRADDFIPFHGEYLNLVMQAKNQDGKWVDIENIYGAFCGTVSNNIGILPAGHYWSYVIPQYEGAIKTKLRMVLNNAYPLAEDEGEYWYSNEFKGGVNPGQFYGNYPGVR